MSMKPITIRHFSNPHYPTASSEELLSIIIEALSVGLI